MTDREKLLRLIDEVAEETIIRRGGEWVSVVNSEEIADHLISNGVTVKEPQKPLTLEQTLEKRVVYLEFKHLLLQEPVVMFRAWNEWEDAEIIHYDRIGCQYSNIDCEENDYGKTWRCWAEKPTEEEREAAEWES